MAARRSEGGHPTDDGFSSLTPDEYVSVRVNRLSAEYKCDHARTKHARTVLNIPSRS